MNKEKLNKTKHEVNRFLEKIKELDNLEENKYYSPSKQAAAVKRASMDLTRSLAELRKSY